MNFIRQTLGCLIVSSAALSAAADVKLPAIFSDNMVLQKGEKTAIFGWADNGEKVTVKAGAASAEATGDADGNWKVTLDTTKLDGAFDVTVTGKNSVTIKNAIVGEVYIASGQSNMEMEVHSSMNAKEETAAANDAQLRMFTVQKEVSPVPLKDVKGKWELSNPANVGHFSAVGYFFARELREKLNVPVGIIHTSWGGTVAEAWTSGEALAAADPDVKVIWDRWTAQQAALPQAKAKYEADLAAWKEAGSVKEKKPKLPAGMPDQNAASNLYNAMVAPLVGYGIRGTIWYQGESNAGRAYQYRKLFPTMITDWRKRWGSDFSFYFVQLANFQAKVPEPRDSDWAELREAQAMTLSLPKTGMAVIIDIGDDKDIHPKNKQDVGKRLAQWALKTDFNKDVEESGPVYDSMTVEGDWVRVKFKHAAGLMAKGDKPTGFAVAGDDKKFYWADAKIEGDSVLLKSDKVAKPVAVRYGWANNPDCNVYNKANLPASPFRTDDWPGVTATRK